MDQHDLVRIALETRLRKAVGLEIIGSISEYAEAVQYALRLQPDIILLETKAPQGLEILEGLRLALPHSAVIVLTSYPDSREEEQSITLGAVRYLLKTLDTKALVQEIRAVARQQVPLYSGKNAPNT